MFSASNVELSSELSKTHPSFNEFLITPLCLRSPCRGATVVHKTTQFLCPLVIPGNTMILGFHCYHESFGVS